MNYGVTCIVSEVWLNRQDLVESTIAVELFCEELNIGQEKSSIC